MPSKRFTQARTAGWPRQRGIMLIEAMVAILIFSVGILGIVGLQASAVNQSTDARYRSEAAYLAEQLLGRMWVGNRSLTNLQAQYSSCGSSCAGWYSWYQNVQALLPGVSDSSDTKPIVVFSDDPNEKGRVKISVYWRMPTEDSASPPHHYDVESQIGQ